MKPYIPFFILLLTLFSCSEKSENCFPKQLQCEYIINPIGIDVPQPRLIWRINDLRQKAFQSGYKIVAGTDSLEVFNGEGNMWNSQKVKSESMTIQYEGKPLQPFTKYFWAVQVWDMKGKKTVRSNVASFQTGMMQMINWKGDWITDTRDCNLKPAAYFRKEFVANKKVKSAQAYIATGGLYELYINGQRVSNHLLSPAYTRYDRRNLYITHDVTSLINNKNTIGVLLGNGWYNHQSTAAWFFHEAPWRARPRFCFDLRITYIDGTVETISTDKSWKTGLSPITFNSIYTAEHYNANLEQPGWNKIGFNDSNWKECMNTTAPSKNIVSQTMHPIRNIKEISPIGLRKINSQKYIFNLGRNIAGISKIKVKGAKGTVLRVSHAELLHQNGEIDQSNIDRHFRPTDNSDPFHTDIYTLKGDGWETFSPHFNYKGFQYIEVVSSKPIDLTKNSLTGIMMHSDVPPIGSIKSSNNTLNKIWEAANSSYLANLYGYPTDCPQREKNGWTGDAHIAIETGLYNFDAITIYEKWLADHRDEQQPNGVLPAIIPTSGWGYHWANGPDWTSTIAIIPWNIYLFYGDSKLLGDCYENIKQYVGHISQQYPDFLTDWGLGDWVPVKSRSPKEFTSSIYYFIDASILSNTAKLFGKNADYKKYSKLAGNIKKAINTKYFNKETALYGSGFQTELSTALFWDIVPEAYRQSVADNLAKSVIANNKFIDVGLLGSKAILNALSENGYADLAFEVASKETFPSWGWWIINGATTLFESWDIGPEEKDNSRNHIMFGEISAWYFKALGGIKPDEKNPGFKNIIIEPHFVNGLEHFEAKHTSPFGEIVSSWKKENGNIHYNLTIPPNSTATLIIEAKEIKSNNIDFIRENEKLKSQLKSGNYKFLIEK